MGPFLGRCFGVEDAFSRVLEVIRVLTPFWHVLLERGLNGLA